MITGPKFRIKYGPRKGTEVWLMTDTYYSKMKTRTEGRYFVRVATSEQDSQGIIINYNDLEMAE